MPNLKVEHLNKSFSTFSLKDISFELPEGYICCLIGENGAGKTTLLNILTNLYAYDHGEISYGELEYAHHICEIKEQIGFVLHGDLFDLNRTLVGNGNYYGSFYKKYDPAVLMKYLQRFSLSETKKYRHLSKGEKLKFAFAFALSHDPSLLLLDEPEANFDPDFRKEFHQALRDFTADERHSVIFSTHMTTEVEQLADYILFLKDGKNILFGDIEKVRASYRMAAGEKYKIKLLGDAVIHMEEGEFGCKALFRKNGKKPDFSLKVWEPSIEELMYYIVKSR